MVYTQDRVLLRFMEQIIVLLQRLPSRTLTFQFRVVRLTIFIKILFPDVGASSVCQRMHDGRLVRKSGYSRFDSSLAEVREVMPLASDAPGSIFGELVNLTRDSGHHSYLARELLLFP